MPSSSLIYPLPFHLPKAISPTMAKNINQIVSTFTLIIFVLNFPATTRPDSTTLPDQTLYTSPPPPYVCSYPCLPPPPANSNCPPPPSSPLPVASPPPSPASVDYPPPSGYYSPPTGYIPYYPPPGYVYYAPPPPDPILPYFPFYYKQPPPPPDFSPASCLRSVMWIPCMNLLLLFPFLF